VTLQSAFDDTTAPMLLYLVQLGMISGGFFFFLMWLFEPKVIENPGIAVYRHPSSQMVPLPRVSDVPRAIESAELARLAKAEAPATFDNKSKVSRSKTRATVAKKKPRQNPVPPGWYQEPTVAYQSQRGGYRPSTGRYNYWL
jgi:hypothetical protein